MDLVSDRQVYNGIVYFVQYEKVLKQEKEIDKDEERRPKIGE